MVEFFFSCILFLASCAVFVSLIILIISLIHLTKVIFRYFKDEN